MGIIWRTEFDIAPLLNSFPYPRCVQRQSATRGYWPRGRFRARERFSVLQYSLSGSGVVQAGKSRHPVKPGTGFLGRVDNPRLEYGYPDDAVEPWEFIFIAFYGAEAQVRELLDRNGPVFALPPDDPVLRRLHGFQSATGTTVRLTPADATALVMDVVLALTRSASATRVGGAASRLAATAREFIAANVEREMTVRSVALALGVTSEHLCRVFREQTGHTPLEHITRARIRRACELLKETHLTAKEVAARVAAGSPSQFGRLFRRVTGMTPLEFRASGVVPLF